MKCLPFHNFVSVYSPLRVYMWSGYGGGVAIPSSSLLSLSSGLFGLLSRDRKGHLSCGKDSPTTLLLAGTSSVVQGLSGE